MSRPPKPVLKARRRETPEEAMSNESEIAAHEELRRQVAREAESQPPWMLSYDTRRALREAGIQLPPAQGTAPTRSEAPCTGISEGET